MSQDYLDRQAGKLADHPKWYLSSRFLAFILIVFVVGVGIWGLGYAFNWFSAPAKGKLQARQQINSGDFRIAAYNHFFDLCASVQTADNNIETQLGLLAQTPKSDKSDRQRILTNIGGLESTRADGINQYNADARKSYTIGQFKSGNLPYQLPTHTYQKGEQLSCTAS